MSEPGNIYQQSAVKRTHTRITRVYDSIWFAHQCHLIPTDYSSHCAAALHYECGNLALRHKLPTVMPGLVVVYFVHEVALLLLHILVLWARASSTWFPLRYSFTHLKYKLLVYVTIEWVNWSYSVWLHACSNRLTKFRFIYFSLLIFISAGLV